MEREDLLTKKELNYSCFLQNEPRYNDKEAWPAESFPTAQYRYFREAGCLVCSLAFMLRYHEIEKEADTDVFNPWILCEKLIGINAFSPAADLEITAVNRLYPLRYLGVIEYSGENLADAVKKGYACLITVRGCNGPVHFIALEELTEKDAVVFDPKAGSRLLSDYEEAFQIRLFRKSDHIQAGDDYIFRYFGRGSVNKSGKIAIGFDDGPLKNTEKVLDVLEQYHIRASFFLVGNLIRGRESVVQRMVRDGHQVGVHGWEHFYMNALSEDECFDSIRKTAEEIRNICGKDPKIMRPPGGYANDSVLKTAESLGLSVIGWCVDSGDWLEGISAEKVADNVLKEVSAGDIILMHDIRPATANALEILVPELLHRGLTPVTIDELAAESEEMKPGKIYNWF